MALWKHVVGYEDQYLVSDEGEVYSIPRVVSNGRGEYVRKGLVLKPGLRGKPGMKYQFVILSKNSQEKHKAVHRLVAEAFLEKPEGKDVINHIDHNTLNNRVDNLEWCDQQYNTEYGHNIAVQQFTADGEKIAEYKSITYASEMTGINRRSINNVLSGYAKTAGGYTWKYATTKERG